MANGFFEANCPFGGFDGWVPQTGGNSSKTNSQATMLNASGDFHAQADYDEKETITATYKANSPGAEIPAVGQVLNGYHIDSVEISWSQTDFVSMTVNGHKHLTGKGDSKCRTYAPSLETDTVGGFGCPGKIGPFNIGTQTVGIRSASYSLTCNHVDELDGEGKHFASDNYDGTETLNIELTGKGTFATADGWHLDTEGDSMSNTGATTSNATYSRHIQGERPA